MKFRHRSSANVEIDISLTPLIDVVFLLLIFFMVTTTFDRQTGIKIDLPKASTKAEAFEQVEVVIDAQGRFYVDDHAVTNTQVATLRKALKVVLDESPDKALVIRADGRAPHQAFVTVMDVAQLLGVKRLKIATQRASDSTQP